MTVLLFEYGHSKINTLNGRWAGEDKVSFIKLKKS